MKKQKKTRDPFSASTVSRVLIVEDNSTNKLLLEKMLSKLGVTKIDHAENGRVAVELVNLSQANPYDIIFMDCQMPVMGGYEATSKIRDLEEADSNFPSQFIIGVSAGAMEGDEEHALSMGMNHYITKPFRIATLRNAIESSKKRS